MGEANKILPSPPSGPLPLGRAALVLASMLICEIFLLCAYFTMMSFLMLLSPGSLETWRLVAMGSHMLAVVLYFAALLGMFMCLDGRPWLISPVRRLLITLAVLGMSVSSIALYERPDETSMIVTLWSFEGLSVLLLVNTVAAFQLME
jgi:hypothetical protein